jgi:hypothetical protein
MGSRSDEVLNCRKSIEVCNHSCTNIERAWNFCIMSNIHMTKVHFISNMLETIARHKSHLMAQSDSSIRSPSGEKNAASLISFPVSLLQKKP